MGNFIEFSIDEEASCCEYGRNVPCFCTNHQNGTLFGFWFITTHTRLWSNINVIESSYLVDCSNSLYTNIPSVRYIGVDAQTSQSLFWFTIDCFNLTLFSFNGPFCGFSIHIMLVNVCLLWPNNVAENSAPKFIVYPHTHRTSSLLFFVCTLIKCRGTEYDTRKKTDTLNIYEIKLFFHVIYAFRAFFPPHTINIFFCCWTLNIIFNLMARSYHF